MRPGDTQKVDSEYKRNGTCGIFVFVEPLGGVRHVSVREQQTAADWAVEIKYLVDVSYPAQSKIILVMDNLNTHAIASLYKTFPAKEAGRIARKLEIHFTPKHGSWLDIAEIELYVMTRQCLSRIEDIEKLRHELKAWEADRNHAIARINTGTLQPMTPGRSLYRYILNLIPLILKKKFFIRMNMMLGSNKAFKISPLLIVP